MCPKKSTGIDSVRTYNEASCAHAEATLLCGSWHSYLYLFVCRLLPSGCFFLPKPKSSSSPASPTTVAYPSLLNP